MSNMPEGMEFREMQQHDVPHALGIIEDHDEDDHEWAATSYQDSLFGQFVLVQNGYPVGVTGANPVEGTDRTWAVSWTYLKQQLKGQGYGRLLMDNLLEYLRSMNARKVFVSTSDYIDPEDGDIYRDARELYQAAGFQEELRHPSYYAMNETQINYGLRLQPLDIVQHDDNELNIRLTDIDEIPECDGAYWLSWELGEEGSDASGFEMIVEQVQQWGGRSIFMAFPSDMTAVSGFMSTGSFRMSGSLKDYYEDGVDELHYRYDLPIDI